MTTKASIIECIQRYTNWPKNSSRGRKWKKTKRERRRIQTKLASLNSRCMTWTSTTLTRKREREEKRREREHTVIYSANLHEPNKSFRFFTSECEPCFSFSLLHAKATDEWKMGERRRKKTATCVEGEREKLCFFSHFRQ